MVPGNGPETAAGGFEPVSEGFGVPPDSIDTEAVPTVREGPLEKLRDALSQRGKLGEIVITLRDFRDGTFDSMVRASHENPPSKELAEKLEQQFDKFTRYGIKIAPLVIPPVPKSTEEKGEPAIIGISSSKDGIDHWTIDALGTAVKKVFAKSVERLQIVVLPPDQLEGLQELSLSKTKRHQYFQEIDPNLVTTQLFRAIIDRAISARASDIHIEPTDEWVKRGENPKGSAKEREGGPGPRKGAPGTEEQRVYNIRFRIDGVLHPAGIPLVGEHLVNVIRTRANIPHDKHFTPQSAGIHFTREDLEAYKTFHGRSLRVEVSPTINGQAAVIRILEKPSADRYELGKLGFTEQQLDLVRRFINTPFGVLIFTGPTGSGKTTSLYACLRELNNPETKILTVEDPVEATFKGMCQYQVNYAQSFGWSEALRSFLRSDPDVILVGEVRDQDTAEIMVQAAMTGHLVFSTTHTLDSFGVLDRLIKNFKVSQLLLQDSLLGVVSQRLARRLCKECVEPFDARADLNKAFGSEVFKVPTADKTLPLDLDPDAVIMYRPSTKQDRHCACCQGKGYKGQTVIAEVWPIGPEESRLMGEEIFDHRRYLEAAFEKGFSPMAMTGLGYALRGVTTLDELMARVINPSQLQADIPRYRDFILANRLPLKVREIVCVSSQQTTSNGAGQNIDSEAADKEAECDSGEVALQDNLGEAANGGS